MHLGSTKLTIEQATAYLDTLPKEYHYQTLPGPVDHRIIQLVEDYMGLSKAYQARFSTLLTQSACSRLSMFAERMAMLSVRKKSAAHLEKGLMALLMTDGRLDYHDMLMTLSLVVRSAQKLALDEDLFFTQVTRHAYRPTIVEDFKAFLRRRPEDKSIQAMGFQEIEGPRGFVYWLGYKPLPEDIL